MGQGRRARRESRGPAAHPQMEERLAPRRAGPYCPPGRVHARLIEIDPDDARAHKRLGRALGAQGKVNEGVAHLQKAIVLKPDEDEPHYDLASIYLRLGRMPEALNEFREVVRLNPRDYQ